MTTLKLDVSGSDWQHPDVLRSLALWLCVLTTPSVIIPSYSAFAQDNLGISINLAPDAQRLANELRVDINQLRDQIENELAAVYGLLNVEAFLQLAADNQSLVPAGIGADYASNPTGFFFGLGINAALTTDDSAITEGTEYDVRRSIPLTGGAALSLLFGYNFHHLGISWFTLSGYGMHFPLSVNQLEGTFTNFGLNGQFKVYSPRTRGWVKWGGIDITTGVNFARTQLQLADESFNEAIELGTGVFIDTGARGVLELEQEAINLSLEVSSNLTMAHFFTIYGGFGIDAPLGSASGFFDLNTNLVGRLTGNEIVDAGNASIDISASEDAQRFLPRLLGGVQFNIWLIKIFAQLNLSLRGDTFGVATGLRAVF